MSLRRNSNIFKIYLKFFHSYNENRSWVQKQISEYIHLYLICCNIRVSSLLTNPDHQHERRDVLSYEKVAFIAFITYLHDLNTNVIVLAVEKMSQIILRTATKFIVLCRI